MRFALSPSERKQWSKVAIACWRATLRLRAVNLARARAGLDPQGDARKRLLQAELRLDELDRAHGYRRPGRECLRCGFVDCSCMKDLRHTPELPERLSMRERQLALFDRPLEQPVAQASEVCGDCDRGPLLVGQDGPKCSNHVFDRMPASARRSAQRR